MWFLHYSSQNNLNFAFMKSACALVKYLPYFATLIRPWIRNEIMYLKVDVENLKKSPSHFSITHVRICVKDATPLFQKSFNFSIIIFIVIVIILLEPSFP